MPIRTGNFIKLSLDGRHFVENENGKYFVPIGCNYFTQNIGWPPKIWERFKPEDYERDFEVMRKMSMNVIRVFLSLKPFMPENKRLSDDCIEKCEKMLDLAGQYGIRIIFSGPSAWEGTPEWAKALKESWYNYFCDEDILENLEFFWENFCRYFRDHAALFSIDLFNEPYIKWDLPSRRNAWIEYLKNRYGSIKNINEAWNGEFAAVNWQDIGIPEDANVFNSPMIWDYQLFKNEISRNFVKRCVNAIRKYDKNHLVSIGLHPGTVPFDGEKPGRYFGFDPHYIGDLLDYISLHWYPYYDDMELYEKPENFEKNMALLMASVKYVHINKPVILEEFGYYGGGTAPNMPWRKPFSYITQKQQADWTLGVIERSKEFCSGWLNWGFMDYPEAQDPTRYQGFFDDYGNLKELGKRFPDVAALIREWVVTHPKINGEKRIKLILKELVTDGKNAQKFREKVIKEFIQTSDIEFDIFTGFNGMENPE